MDPFTLALGWFALIALFRYGIPEAARAIGEAVRGGGGGGSSGGKGGSSGKGRTGGSGGPSRRDRDRAARQRRVADRAQNGGMLDAVSQRLADRVANPPPRGERGGPARRYFSGLWADSWDDAADRRLRRRERRAARRRAAEEEAERRRREEQAGSREDGTRRDVGGHTDDVVDAELVDETEGPRNCGKCGAGLPEGSWDCPNCNHLNDDPTDEDYGVDPTPVDFTKEPKESAMPTIDGDVRDPEAALGQMNGFTGTCQEMFEWLEQLLNAATEAGVAAEPIDEIKQVMDGIQGLITGSLNTAREEFQRHVQVRNDIAANPQLAETQKDTWLRADAA